jgi:hypothetical protein
MVPIGNTPAAQNRMDASFIGSPYFDNLESYNSGVANMLQKLKMRALNFL